MSLSRSTSRSEPVRPFALLASIWIVALALTGYCATELRAWTQTRAELEGSELLDVTAGLQRIGEESGLSSVHDGFEHMRERWFLLPDAVSDENLQHVLSAAVRLYAAKSEEPGRVLAPFGDRPVNATEAVTAICAFMPARTQ